MSFRLLSFSCGQSHDARFDESLIELAGENGPSACVWESAQGLVVPRTYKRFDAFPAACEHFALQGWPITVRQSGGGIVPQGPGILNLSLAYAVQGKPLDHSDEAYLLICKLISDALQDYGIATHPQAVEGSFCDGRYNLAVDSGEAARKVAGTAQLWRRHANVDTGITAQIVLVHALILAAVDIDAVTARANDFEQVLDSGKRYASNRIASLHDLCETPFPSKEMFTLSLKDSLKHQLTRPEITCGKDSE